MTKRQRSDSTTSAIDAMETVRKGAPKPPSHVFLPDEAIPFWNAVVTSKDYSLWTPFDLVMAAQLARISWEIETYFGLTANNERLIQNGDIKAVSPVHKILHDLIGEKITLCRLLQIHPRATIGEAQSQAKRNQLFFETRESLSDSDLHALIATPTKRKQ